MLQIGYNGNLRFLDAKKVDIDALLKPYQRFGVHLGLERIQQLLKTLDNPHEKMSIIHVAGTNGKGSVCAYLSSVLTEAGYRVGCYTSPHLVHWQERICLNETPISEKALTEMLQRVEKAMVQLRSPTIAPNTESPTQFEVITAAAWLYFAQSQADIAVIEVGLGGRLDATNVCDRPLVTVITSISREHWQVLGPTIGDIATEKAGILKPGCPAVIGQLPDAAKTVIQSRLEALNCPALWVEPAQSIREGWGQYNGLEYPLSLHGEIQLMNSALAIAVLQILQQQGWNLPDSVIQSGMSKTQWLGRLQWLNWKDNRILIDGAHNPAAALALRQYVDTLNQSVIWVMGMLSTKDHQDIFQALLRPGDRLYLVPVPDHSSADPEILALLAGQVCPHLQEIQTFPAVFTALETALKSDQIPVLCGSLYLIGHFLGQLRVNG